MIIHCFFYYNKENLRNDLHVYLLGIDKISLRSNSMYPLKMLGKCL